MICPICEKEVQRLGSHISRAHKIDPKTYYDDNFKTDPNEGICPICGKPTKFIGIGYGYYKHCSYKCSNNDENTINIAKQTKLEKYGDPNYNNRELFKQTSIDKYGGVGYASPEIKLKAENTTFKKYGHKIAFAFGTDEYNQNIFDKYGVQNYMSTEECKEKIKQTCNNRYNVACTFQVKEFRDKAKETRINNLGAYNDQNKIKNTKFERYGDSNYNNREKAEKTCNERYGVNNPTKSLEIQRKSKSHYLYNGTYFDSSWELALWIYAEDHNEEIEREPCRFEYYMNNKKHYYFPDFKYKGELLEIKGDQFFNKDGTFKYESEKYQCMIDNNVIIWKSKEIYPILNYVKEKYGKNYLKQFKYKLSKGGDVNE